LIRQPGLEGAVKQSFAVLRIFAQSNQFFVIAEDGCGIRGLLFGKKEK
jgi:hypothetical protein